MSITKEMVDMARDIATLADEVARLKGLINDTNKKLERLGIYVSGRLDDINGKISFSAERNDRIPVDSQQRDTIGANRWDDGDRSLRDEIGSKKPDQNSKFWYDRKFRGRGNGSRKAFESYEGLP